TIKAHIAAGDKARDKADQHYIAAGQHLKTLKEQHGGTFAEWETLLKEKVGIGKSRASELMQIADGRKTGEEVAAATTERSQRHRALSVAQRRDHAEQSAEAEEISDLHDQKTIRARYQRSLFGDCLAAIEEMSSKTRTQLFMELKEKYDHRIAAAEQIRQVESQNVGLKSEVEELRAASADLGRVREQYVAHLQPLDRVEQVAELLLLIEATGLTADELVTKHEQRHETRPESTGKGAPVDDGLDIPECLPRTAP